jgi:hypothetical protein
MPVKKKILERIIGAFLSTVEVEGVGPIKKFKARAIVLIILVPALVISAIVLKHYNVF